ncbi:stimulated by retinoic acid gene 6 protein-like [Rhopilema esculentum]|uniref:stimulated by retinoic acid gene 6 protein-like n=1 Tax=Rhopilema esculentum TaxID=499914 RepID=UPI0031D29E17
MDYLRRNANVSAIINTLFAYQYLNTTTDPSKLGGALTVVLQSNPQLMRLVNSTGLSLQTVTSVIVDIYNCVNKTISADGNPMSLCLGIEKTNERYSLEQCLDLKADTNALVLLVLGVFSFFFLIAGSLLNRRKSACLNFLHGRPALVVPLNMLDSYENRFGCALAFGVTTSYCIDVLFGSAQTVVGSRIGKVIGAAPSSINLVFKIVSAMVIANAAFPLFVCIRTKFKIIGSLFGIFYCTAWIVLLYVKLYLYYHMCVTTLSLRSEITQLFESLGEIPQLICLVALLVRFTRVLIHHSLKKKGARSRHAETFQQFQETYMLKHVANLLKAVPKMETGGTESLKLKIRKKVYKWKPEFRYSTRIISAFMVSGITIYIITVKLLFTVWYFDFVLEDFVQTEKFKTTINRFFPDDKTLLYEIGIHLDIWIVCLYVAIGIASVKTYLVFLNMLSWYRGHITRLRKGEKSWLPSAVRKLSASPPSLLAAGMKYAGFQVAYTAWAFMITVFLLLLILGAASSFLIYPAFNGKSAFILEFLAQIWPAILLSVLLYLSQFLSAKYLFLQQSGAVMSIDNRSIFHLSSYYMFFFNMFLGLFSCLMRIIKGLVIGVLFLERVQKSLLPRSFENMDPGYYAYVGYILVEHYHANPVQCVFFYLLKEQLKAVKRKRASMAVIINNDFIVNGETVSKGIDFEMQDMQFSKELNLFDKRKIIRNKWYLCYTLVNNPSLVKYRKSNLDEKEENLSETEQADSIEEEQNEDVAEEK